MFYTVDLASAVNTCADKLTLNKAKILRYTHYAQLACGLFLLLFGYSIGKDHFRLVRAGVRAPGVIVEYRPQIFHNTRTNSTTTGFMPVVQFQANGRTFRFKDWLGANSTAPLQRVTVLYDPDRPANAMIDRAIMNWIPWGPTMGIGLFLLLVGFAGLTYAARAPQPASATPALQPAQ